MPTCEICDEDLPQTVPGNVGPEQCWMNAEILLGFLNQQQVYGFYVEGWAVHSRAGALEPFEHGWVELDARVIDITPHNHVAHGDAYFPAFRQLLSERDPAVDVPLCRNTYAAQGHCKFNLAIADAYEVARQAALAYCEHHHCEHHQPV